MDRFLLDNTVQYQALVKAFSPTPAPGMAKDATGAASPDIVVSARIRPLLNEDVAAGFPCAVFPRSAQNAVVDIHDLYNHPRGRPILKVRRNLLQFLFISPLVSHTDRSKSFNYEVDRLFNSQTTTEEIYKNLVWDLVPFAWNGGIGSIFTYGQTVSGKTFTVSRLEQLVAKSLMDGSLEGQRHVYITIVDLAGNLAYDLLNSRKPVSILEDSFGVTQLAGANQHLVQDRDEMMDLIDRAASFRRTSPTLKNHASSRSHCICRIRIHNPSTDSDGLLYLIDLAGSEAARDVAVHGAERMRETREINTSLSVLKDCIRGKAQSDLLALSGGSKLKQRKPYVPFRQSALTKVLKHVFEPAGSRACKTVVIACLNPSLADVGPSKNTLRYAEMLRVLLPTTNKLEPSLVNPIETTELDSNLGSLTLTNRLSSRDLDPTATAVPFVKRIRPGMVVSWNQLPGSDLTLKMPDKIKLAVILCPVEAVQQTVKDILGNMVNPSASEHAITAEKGIDSHTRYLCALLAPALMVEAYELNLWRQIVIDVGMMDKEIFLEYDAGTRYYYISV
jgi:kinesin family protein 2/24